MGGLPDRDGTTTRWHSFDTQEEAEKARRQVLAGIRRLQQAAEALTWAEAIDQYCTARAEECRALSIDTLRGRLRRFFHDALQPAKLTADQAQALYNTLRPKVSVQEHRHCLSRARALGAWLVSQGMWKDNPLLLRQAERARRRPTKPQGEVVTISPPLWGRDRWWVHREVTRCCKAAGVPLVPPHGLRGTWASLARAVATAPVAVAATLGQAGTEVQERHYARPDAIAAGHQVAVLQVIRGGTR